MGRRKVWRELEELGRPWLAEEVGLKRGWLALEVVGRRALLVLGELAWLALGVVDQLALVGLLEVGLQALPEPQGLVLEALQVEVVGVPLPTMPTTTYMVVLVQEDLYRVLIREILY